MRWFLICAAVLSMLFSVGWGQVYISGVLSGTLMDTTYIVTGDIWVEEGDSLVIEGGAELFFNGAYSLDIYGYLYAVGTEEDSIKFIPNAGAIAWAGIDFNDSASDSSRLEYCVISGSDSSGIYLYYANPTLANCTISGNSGTNTGSSYFYGGGIYCFNSSPEITECIITDNSVSGFPASGGAGICCRYYSNPIISNCAIAENTTSSKGGGIFCNDHSSPTITNCIITNNSAHSGAGINCYDYSSPYIFNCDIRGNSTTGGVTDSFGGGIRCTFHSNAVVESCAVIDNSANFSGGGVHFDNESNVTLFACDISFNTAHIGGGICISVSEAIIENCTITNNTADSWGGGISCYEDVCFINCTISGNNAVEYGGGAYCYNEPPVSFTNCNFSRNSAERGGAIYGGDVYAENCEFRENTASSRGGAVSTDNQWSDIILTYCAIFDNESEYRGGGLSSYDEGNIAADHCVFYGNSADFGGGAHCSSNSNLDILNCTFYQNSVSGNGGGIYFSGSSVVDVANSIFKYNNGGAIYCSISNGWSVRYSDFLFNTGGNFAGNPPPELGQIITFNANGTSCDTFYNIFVDPRFIDEGNANFYLLSDSPCIDAGDPLSHFDPDSTIADIGAFYFDQSTRVEESSFKLAPLTFDLSASPNPFNANTVISYKLQADSYVELKVYDVMGREVHMAVSSWQLAGEHQVVWDAEGLGSGVYFVRLSVVGGQSSVRKMLLVK